MFFIFICNYANRDKVCCLQLIKVDCLSLRLTSVLSEASKLASEAYKKNLDFSSQRLSVAYGRLSDLKPKVSFKSYNCIYFMYNTYS